MFLKKIPLKLIGELLVEEGYLEPEHLEKGLALQKKEGGRIGEILVKNGWLEEEQLAMGLSKQLSLPFINLSGYTVNREALKLIPREKAQRYLLFPFECEDGSLSISMYNPLEPEALHEAEKLTGQWSVQIFLATASEIQRAIREHYGDAILSQEGGETGNASESK